MPLTYEMVTKLHSVGFTFEQFEHLGLGTYAYEGVTYTLGGAWDGSPRSELDQRIAREGVWLPDEGDLARWLELTDHKFEIRYEDGYYRGTAEDEQENVFQGSGPDLLTCLYKMIFKICRDARGAVKPRCIPILKIEP